jgi:hypothetical protein
MAKLSEKFTGQHMALFAAAGSVILLNIIDSLKGPTNPDDQLKAVSSNGSKYSNPSMSWYQKIFCRGYQRSLNCGFQFLHPMKDSLEEDGKVIREGAPKDGVVVYRGHLKGSKDPFHGKIQFDPND